MNNLTRSFNKVFRSIKSLEQHKHLEPKFSSYCMDLASHLGYEETSLSHGQPSHSSINTDFDFHILNDVLAYDSSRIDRPKISKSRMNPIMNKIIGRYTEDSRKTSKKSLHAPEKPPRTSSTRVTPNIYEPISNKSYHSVTKSKKSKKIDAAQLYHDQAMSLIYTAIDQY